MNAKSNLATQDEALVVERVFDAPVALVWRALTDIDDLRNWFLDIREFEPRVGFEFQFYAGKDQTKYLHGCKVAEVVPNKRLAYTWGAARTGVEGVDRSGAHRQVVGSERVSHHHAQHGPQVRRPLALRHARPGRA